MWKTITAIAVAILALSLTGKATAHQARGFIYSSEEEKCWFSQSETEGPSPFSNRSNMSAQVVRLTFDSPTCMKLNQINIQQIAWRVAKPYSHDDANFSKDLRVGSGYNSLFSETICVQSQTYKMAGVLFGYVTKEGYITGAAHHTSVGGCSNVRLDYGDIPLN